jgi:hypothetical protein
MGVAPRGGLEPMSPVLSRRSWTVPRVVVPLDPDAVRQADLELWVSGWEVGVLPASEPAPGTTRSTLEGEARTPRAWSVTLPDEPDYAAAAALALDRSERGDGLVVAVAADGLLGARLTDSLRRLGPVADRREVPSPLTGLCEEQLRLLLAVGEGVSIAAATAALGLSERTAHRRVRAACELLGAPGTAAAALAVARVLGPWRVRRALP